MGIVCESGVQLHQASWSGQFEDWARGKASMAMQASNAAMVRGMPEKVTPRRCPLEICGTSISGAKRPRNEAEDRKWL
jgi:hypothetical protein